MRADPSKRRRYERLLDSRYFAEVVDANRVYVISALPDPRRTERHYWALSCLPTGQFGRPFTRISVRTMETFVLRRAGEAGPLVTGFVIISRTAIEAEFGCLARFGRAFPDLAVAATHYRDAGEDQLSVAGRARDLVAALRQDRFASAARELAARVMRHRTIHWRGHNYLLADHVLGRA